MSRRKGASSLREDRAGHASHGAATASPPSGDHPIARFTPGPWAVVCDSDERPILISANLLAPSGKGRNGGMYVARTAGIDDEANARLIAAAPDLYEALGNLMGTSELNDENRAAMAEAAALRRRVRGQ